MPHLDERNRTAAHFREHYVVEPAPAKEPHWLLNALYGRDLLKMKLRQVAPRMYVSKWKYASHLDPLLDRMVDELGLREVARPRTLRQKLRYIHTVTHSMLALEKGLPLPVWAQA
ncbi:MAG: hypothetical protein KF871_12760 [Hydrogenophaga sp.]|uniref:hypothetical protein n=1 Tax=Hydrogenophaga sp. TaxID=1904254 RepID=UPI001DCE7C33|nr:hypothetical protein [Hydrogenophaga sp.]MBX3610758.1 hypothetical protein [Hydrogenophaga sp.]